MNKTTENEYSSSDMSPAFHDAARLRRMKSGDYGSIRDYFPYDDMSYMQMIHVKTKRLVHLADQKRMGIEPTHESIKDNLLDLINYASYYYEFLEGGLDE